jgi:hypothetical protein
MLYQLVFAQICRCLRYSGSGFYFISGKHKISPFKLKKYTYDPVNRWHIRSLFIMFEETRIPLLCVENFCSCLVFTVI